MENESQEAQATTEGSTETTESATVVDSSTGETVSETTYANGKYKSVSDLENGYAEAQKFISSKLGGFEGAPESYELGEGVEANAVTDALSQWGLENSLSNEGLNSVLNVLSEAETAQANAYRESQVEALGKDADTRIKNATDWVKANLGEEAVEGVNSMWVGAKGIEAIEKMMKLSQGTAPAEQPANTFADAEKLKAMRFAKDEYGNRRMSSDPAYRDMVLKAEAAMKDGNTGYVVRN